MSREDVPEESLALAAAVRESEVLGAWFLAVAKADPDTRTRELARMAAEMRTAGEPPNLIRAVSRLNDSSFRHATAAALSVLPPSS